MRHMSTVVVLGIIALALGGLLTWQLAVAADDSGMGNKPMGGGMSMMAGEHKAHMGHVAEAMAAIEAAKKALGEDKKDEALKQLDVAKEHLAMLQKSMTKMHESMMMKMPAGKAENMYCPMTTDKIDPKQPTREFKGHVVGFCCSACQPAWDKLTDEEKQAKWDAAMKKQADAATK